MVSLKDAALKLNKFEQHNLGQLEIRWVNYLGDPGILKIGPFKSSGESIPAAGKNPAKLEIDLDIVPGPRPED